jgi:ABC-type uncharacterized transport system permease subunit
MKFFEEMHAFLSPYSEKNMFIEKKITKKRKKLKKRAVIKINFLVGSKTKLQKIGLYFFFFFLPFLKIAALKYRSSWR